MAHNATSILLAKELYEKAAHLVEVMENGGKYISLCRIMIGIIRTIDHYEENKFGALDEFILSVNKPVDELGIKDSDL